MASFSNALSIATSGLQAASARSAVAANNIANANTEGYTRRDVVLEERTVGPTGAGVRIVTTTNAQVQYLTDDRMRLEADDAYTSEKATAAERLTDIVGEPGVGNGLFNAYDNFETALKDAAATPESPVLQQQAVDAATDLSLAFQQQSAAADAERTTADGRIDDIINEVNVTLQRLEELNALPTSDITPEVQDERQRLVDQINAEIPVIVDEQGPIITLATEGGVFLLTERAHTIDFDPAGNVGRTESLGAPLSGISVNGVDITPTGDAPQRSSGGRISALFEHRDEVVPAFQDQLDALAIDVIDRFADDAVDPTKAAGEAGLFTFGGSTAPPAAGTQGVAQQIQVNALVDPSQGGDAYRIRDGIGATAEGPEGNGDQLARLVEAFAGDRTAPAALGVAGERSAAELAAEVASAISFDDQKASDAALYASTRYEVAREAEIAATGVDTDGELQKLLVIEQAYAANARVIQTIQQMLDELLSII